VKLRVLWIGKTQQAWVRTGIEEYAGRVRRYFPLEITEVREEKGSEAESLRVKEGERLLKNLPGNARLVLLDERGTEMTSPQFAAFLGNCRDRGFPELAFAVGGAYGFPDTVRARADLVVAFSLMTFTHQMVRVFLLEQIYRGCTILNREPYHH
jgi:23S rRNA (pseudouridine1915-N3)-methyltransferase